MWESVHIRSNPSRLLMKFLIESGLLGSGDKSFQCQRPERNDRLDDIMFVKKMKNKKRSAVLLEKTDRPGIRVVDRKMLGRNLSK